MTETATTTNQGPVPTNEAIVRRFIDEILNQGRFELIPELIHPEYRYIGPDGTELLGRDALADLLRGFRSGFSDLEARVATTVDHSDVVAMTMTLTGTHDGDFDGIPPTGAHLELPIAIFTTLADGQSSRTASTTTPPRCSTSWDLILTLTSQRWRATMAELEATGQLRPLAARRCRIDTAWPVAHGR